MTTSVETELMATLVNNENLQKLLDKLGRQLDEALATIKRLEQEKEIWQTNSAR